MERSISMDIRVQRDDLKRVAEQSMNAMLELDLECNVRWVSPSWQDLTGAAASSIVGRPIADSLVDKKEIFHTCIESLRKDDSKSRIIRFSIASAVPHGREDALSADEKTPVEPQSIDSLLPDNTDDTTLERQRNISLEAQGIIVYDRVTGEESHSMWMVRPAISREITFDLPDVLVETLGVGAEVLANYLNMLAEVGFNDPEHNPPPLPVMCRICERQISPWWFEKHTELCSQEHRAEMEVQMAHEGLNEQRSALVKVLDTLEAQHRHARPTSADSSSTPPPSPAEYKGMLIGHNTSSSSSSASGRASPGTTPLRSRESSQSGFGHHRARSFAVRRPLSRIVELVLDLCDTAMEISTPTIKDNKNLAPGEIRTQSPQSESRITQVMQWQSPSSTSLENEEGLSVLCEDTAELAKAKVNAVFRHRQVLEYAERIRIELHVLVQECIEAAFEKTSRIAAGEISDSDDTSDYDSAASAPEESQETQPTQASETPDQTADAQRGSPIPNAMAMALRKASNPSLCRRTSSAGSSRASSPHAGTTTPKSYIGMSDPIPIYKRGSIAVESDTGADSDGSLKSSVASMGHRRADSPGAELTLSRAVSTRSRERKRKSLVLPSLASGSRHQSPARGPPGPSSPLRISKPRIPSGADGIVSPITSPILMGGELHSPILRAHTQAQNHHRRQSSAALSEPFGRPLSPRLNAVQSNQQPRAVQTSIKDFEIIKPISKGAFGSVYLAKKKSTGDYYAIKVLKKADMVAKNQVTNVKAERAIMMWQGESDFVAKLYWTFSSKDYLYLVMEYLNGGDCASLIKVLGALPEDWTQKYIGEVVLCVQHLHGRQIVHRDLKPDNLLIDAKGHLKLTDFGLSRMGMIGRQKRVLDAKPGDAPPDLLKQGPFRRAPSIGSSRSTSFDMHMTVQSPSHTPALTPFPGPELSQPSYFSLNREASASREQSRQGSNHRSDSGESEALANAFRRFSIAEGRTPIEEETASEEGGESPDPYALHPVPSNAAQTRIGTPPLQPSMPPPMMSLFDPEDNSRRFVGTPDYLAPETIRGHGQDEMSDWWSLGCILFECIYGRPPFNADTPEEVFKNILDRNIQWPQHGEEDCASAEAKDLINKLMCSDPKERLGSNKDDKFEDGGEEIKAHPWFADLQWETLRDDEASFIPISGNPEDTEYFDSRGAVMQNFAAEFEDQVSSPGHTPGADYPERPHDALSRVRSQVNAAVKRNLMPLHIPPHVRDGRSRRLSEPAVADDFGNFHFKNLPVLEKANKDVIQKLKADAMQAHAKSAVANSAVSSPSAISPSAPSVESSPHMPPPLKRTLSANKGIARSHSPSVSNSTSSPSRGSQPSSPLLVSFSTGHHERRKTSSGSSSLSQYTSNMVHATHAAEQASRLAGLKGLAVPPPNKGPKSFGQLSAISPGTTIDGSLGVPSPRQRSHTVGSQDGDLVPELLPHHHKRRSGVFDASPSSSDNEESRQKALLRVQRRRQSGRRVSQQINLADGPFFRTLDVLVCEDHPVSRLVMERLLEKLRCRTITVNNGSEAMRYAMSEIKFDVIMMEYKLPQVNGADVARMIRDTRNANSHTPIVAVTGYLKELQAPHNFDALVEKPPTREKLEEVIGRLCQWKSAPEGWRPTPPQVIPPSSLRQESVIHDDSPTTTTSSGFGGFSQALESSYRGSSREDSIGSSSFGEVESQYDSIPVIISRHSTMDFDQSDLERNFGGLGISGTSSPDEQRMPPVLPPFPPQLKPQVSAPASLESQERVPRKQPSTEAINAKRRSLEKGRYESAAESGDDEDEELGHNYVRHRSPKRRAKRASKLGIEMMRTNSQGSVISNDDALALQKSIDTAQQLLDQPAAEVESKGHITPPELFPKQPGAGQVELVAIDTSKAGTITESPPSMEDMPEHAIDLSPTPRASGSPV
ncbi:hypothetical protein AMS68_002468 [Peltaster fructicola]|uniref:non-specific serine/threonine protein kinase n=1 Tax=Peltaster fructicola TaxID=286661 RepID=A0A6H0XQL8_9PEZI|nr:hypothetical protein AMS68_002468 [Peltaster fructicola]